MLLLCSSVVFTYIVLKDGVKFSYVGWNQGIVE
jgi:hypothetical protein